MISKCRDTVETTAVVPGDVVPFAAVVVTSAVGAVVVPSVARATTRVSLKIIVAFLTPFCAGRFPDRSFGDYQGGNKRDYSSGRGGGGGQRGGARGGGSRGGGGGYRGRSEPPRGGQGRSGYAQRGQSRQHQVLLTSVTSFIRAITYHRHRHNTPDPTPARIGVRMSPNGARRKNGTRHRSSTSKHQQSSRRWRRQLAPGSTAPGGTSRNR